MSELIGKVLDGRYRLLAVIGEGSHGVVLRALDLTTKVEVAVKLIRDPNADPEYSVRLVREARAMQALAGTAAVHVHTFASDVDGAFYLVMELLEGASFEAHLVEMAERRQRVSAAALVPILDPIVSTLEVAHAQGIVHRDLKPSNIFLLDQRRAAGTVGVRLLDFGLVKLVRAKPLTRQGIVAGSPSYIAPEAWRGDPTALDQRIDVYSFGTVVFRALAGRVPFDVDDLREKLRLITEAPRPSLRALRSDLPPAIDSWVAQVLAIDPEQRFQKVRAAWRAFRHVMNV